MDEKRLQEIAQKWLNGTATENEKAAFTAWYDEKGFKEQLEVPEDIAASENEHKEKLWNELQERIVPVVTLPSLKRRKAILYKWVAAASVVLLIGTYFAVTNWQVKDELFQTVQHTGNDALPGRDAAILTLANGSQISLDSTNGAIVQQNGITIINTQGLLSYQQQSKTSEEPEYHTISTARGNHYQLLLPDGSRVWLNAASSLKYPTFFKGNERKVELTGEGYFEVATALNPSKAGVLKPFKVQRGDMQVEVLGTHFNINAYEDEESMKVTLLEGAVKVSPFGGQQDRISILKPGQQAEIAAGQMRINNTPDLELVMAWKEGFFQFDNTSTAAMLRQLARWYDMDITFAGKITERKFGGRINRNLNLTQVLNLLKGTGVNFRIEGKKLIVTP